MQAVNAVKFARNHTDDIEFSPEDGSRSEPDFLCRVLEAVIDGRRAHDQYSRHRRLRGARTAGRVDPQPARADSELGQGSLVGALPQRSRHGGGQFARRRVERRAANRMHHQWPGRARRQHLARRSRDGAQDPARLFQPLDAVSTPPRSCPTSKLVSGITGFVVQPNKAVVGANAFAHASGIHQDGVLKSRETYEIMRAEDVGWTTNRIVLGKLSGRNAFRQRLQELGIELESEDEVNDAFQRFKELADKKAEIFDEDIHALFADRADAGVGRALPARVDAASAARPARSRHASIVMTDGGGERTRRSRRERTGRCDVQGDRIDGEERRRTGDLFGQRGDAAAPNRRARSRCGCRRAGGS